MLILLLRQHFCDVAALPRLPNADERNALDEMSNRAVFKQLLDIP